MRITVENLSYTYGGLGRNGRTGTYGSECGRSCGDDYSREGGSQVQCDREGLRSGDTVDALRNISCTIESGDFVGIMGKTGCGKTTLIKLMAGLLVPTGGRICLDGQDINDNSFNRNVLRQSIGVVFQYPEQQLFAATVEKDVAFGLKYNWNRPGSKFDSGSRSDSGSGSGSGSGEIDERVQWALETMEFDYEEVRKLSPMALSGGEKRRVAIAGVLAVKPKIIIFDEPIAGLDPYGRKNFLELAAKLNDNGTTIIMVSHNMDALAEYTKHLLVLEDGRLIMSGETRDVFHRLKNDKYGHMFGWTEPQQVAALISKFEKCQAHDGAYHDDFCDDGFRDDSFCNSGFCDDGFRDDSFCENVVTYDDLISAIKRYVAGTETGTEAIAGASTEAAEVGIRANAKTDGSIEAENGPKAATNAAATNAAKENEAATNATAANAANGKEAAKAEDESRNEIRSESRNEIGGESRNEIRGKSRSEHNSFLRRLDARAKIICLIAMLGVVIGASSPGSYVLALSAVGIIILLSKLPLRHVFGKVGRLWLFFVTIFLMNAFFYQTENVLCSWWIFNPSIDGIRQGFSVIANVVLAIILGNVLTLTTTPTEITMALESLIKPLRLLGVPTEDVAMIISIAIQFIPTLMEETEVIKIAQIARGARFESKKLSERALSFAPLVVPVFLSAFRRADELSLAMEARGYRNAKNRTKRKKEPLELRDYMAACMCGALCLIQFLVLR
ncbi:MAG: CbiQ family ECF transporter T component [Bacillota bacterium]|jgi:energy-coupling factor transporter ATP-binding protein EcfA2/energy-coupling factor transporter transmembrane protein EcfT